MKSIIGVALAAVCALGVYGERTVSLNSGENGVEWKLFRQADVIGTSGNKISTPGFSYSDAVDGIVPGTTFAAYVAAGREENPEWGDNIYNTDEVWYNRPFWYRAEFETPAIAPGERVWLHFDNTHRYASFFLNGKKISGSASTMRDVKGHMVRSRFDITDLLNTDGPNAVAVLITDPNTKKSRTASDPYGITCSPSYMSGAGWDWMPYVPGRLSGITGNAYLRITGEALIDNPWVRGLLPESGHGDVKVTATLKNAGTADKELTLRGTITPGDITFEKTVNVAAGAETEVSVDATDCPGLDIENPRLWWPNGYGEQNLYTCTLEAVDGDQVADRRVVPFGIRRYEWKKITNSENQPVWELYVNGVRVYLKGGNWGISEYLLRCHGEEYETKIKLHKEMNYNMIRLWTGCVTDEEFYDYCDRYGMMVWDDFWLYTSFMTGVAEKDAFKLNVDEKIKRLRNHPCVAMWCGANETHPEDELDNYMREAVAKYDGGDRPYKSCSNDDGLSGSGWWSAQTPDRYFETASNAMFFNGYPFTDTSGYGMRTEIGMISFPNYESVIEFMPENSRWPLPDDETIKNVDNTTWNHHFFGKEGSNGSPADYKNMVNNHYGESSGLEEFCEKAQLLNIESMKGMYEAWNDKLWNDATGLLVWMSNPAYPCFLWQTYDYYYDTPGSYWGAKAGCEHQHIQWNSRTGSIKVINTTGKALEGATATAEVFNAAGTELASCRKSATVNVAASDKAEAFVLDVRGNEAAGIRFVRLTLTDAEGTELSRSVYWHNCDSKYNYKSLNNLPEADVACTVTPDAAKGEGHYLLTLENRSDAVAFATRIRLVNPVTGARILPAMMSDNFITLMPRESRTITVNAPVAQLADGADVLLKQFRKPEVKGASTEGAGIDAPTAAAAGISVGTPGNCELTLGWADGNARLVTVSTMQGVKVLDRSVSSMETLRLPSAGLYVVKAGGEVLKVLVK